MAHGTPLESGPGRSAHLELSRLLIGCAISAIASTGGLIVVTMIAMTQPDGPPPGGGGPRPGGPGIPPHVTDTLAILIVITGLCVLSWLAVLVVYARDQVLARMRAPGTPAADAVARLRAEIAEDHRAALAALEERITEFGEQRETDGYLHGVRATTLATEGGEVRQIRRVPAP